MTQHQSSPGLQEPVTLFERADTLRKMIWEAIAVEADAETCYTSMHFTADDIVAAVREWFPELRASGVDPRFLRAAVLAVLEEIEARGWEETRWALRRRLRSVRVA